MSPRLFRLLAAFIFIVFSALLFSCERVGGILPQACRAPTLFFALARPIAFVHACRPAPPCCAFLGDLTLCPTTARFAPIFPSLSPALIYFGGFPPLQFC
jgi:hypothetical protein